MVGYRIIQATERFQKWYDSVTDPVAKRAIDKRLTRVAAGLFGDVKRIGKVSELRIDVGQGYRVYFANRGMQLIILLAGGDKRTQKADLKLAAKMVEELERK